MTDYDRGAYTPQTDAPLAFDPRRPSERRPMPMALIGSAVVLVVLLAGVVMVYRGGVRHAGESPRPVGEPVMAVKTAPPPGETASTSPPPTNMDVYNAGDSSASGAGAPSAGALGSGVAGSGTTGANATQTAAAGPTFVAPAEQPAARPEPKPATVAMLAKPAAPNHIERRPTPTEEAAATSETPAKPVAASARKTAATPVRTATATTEKTENGSTTTVLAKTTTASPPTHHAALRAKLDQSELAAAGMTRTDADAQAPDVASAHKAKPLKLAAASPTVGDATPAATPPAVPAKAVVQIGAFSSSALADRGYADVSAALPGQMGGKAKHVQSLDKDGTTLYRTWLSGFASRADAQAFCDALKAKGKTCLVRG